jgi:glucose-1-phosphate thymidylyltransferase
MKGIVLAGGSGTRLHPLTVSVSKQLLPIYDKPMIDYPLSVLQQAGLTEVLIITRPDHLHAFQSLLEDGAQRGMRLRYATQASPDGLAQAFIIAESFLAGGPACLVLGDNLFFGHGLREELTSAARLTEGARIFVTRVHQPERYGVLTFDARGQPSAIVEKPQRPLSPWAVTGLYFYDAEVCRHARSLRPSARGELEITDLNRIYLEQGRLAVTRLGPGFSWFDAGTYDSLLDAGNFVRALRRRRG